MKEATSRTSFKKQALLKNMNKACEKIYEVVKAVPEGKVITYGKVAALAGFPNQARMAGYALHRVPEHLNIPWHRVVNAKGEISRLPDPDSRDIQKDLLESEGIKFDVKGKINLKKYSA